MGQQTRAAAERRNSNQFAFIFRNEADVNRFLKLARLTLKRLFPDPHLIRDSLDSGNALICLTEVANNAKHKEGGRNSFPVTLSVGRRGRSWLEVEMRESSSFDFDGVKPQTDLLSTSGRGMWLTHVLCEATLGRLEVDGKRGITRFEYGVGLPEEILKARIAEISENELPAVAVETIRTS